MKNFYLYFILFSLFFKFNSISQNIEWVNHIAKTDGGLEDLNLVVDSKDNLIGLAYYYSFQPTYPPVKWCSDKYYQENSSFPIANILFKLDKNGHCKWSRNLATNEGGLNLDVPLLIDSEDNYYLTSSFSGLIQIVPDSFLNSGSPQHTQIIICKFNSDNEMLWNKILKVNDPSKASPFVLTNHIDHQGNLYLAIDHAQGKLLYDGELLSYNNLTLNYNTTIIKLNHRGELIWSKPLQSAYGGVHAFNIKSDYNGNIVIIGSFNGNLIQVDHFTYYNSDIRRVSTADAFVLKMGDNGKVLWLKGFGNFQTNDYIGGLEIDLHGCIYISGVSSISGPYKILDSIITDSNLIDPRFIAMIDSLGNRKWIKVLDLGQSNNSGSITAMTRSNKLITTWSLTRDSVIIDDRVIFRIGKGTDSQYDMVYLITDTSGLIENAFCWGGNDFDSILDVSLQSDDGVIISGKFSSDTLAFGEHTLYKFKNEPTTYPSTDAFIARISPDGMVATKDYKSNSQSLVSILPNPSIDYIQIQLNTEITGEGELQIMNVEGRIMRDIHVKSGTSDIQLDVRDWPGGVYFVRYIDMVGRSSVRKVVVE